MAQNAQIDEALIENKVKIIKTINLNSLMIRFISWSNFGLKLLQLS